MSSTDQRRDGGTVVPLHDGNGVEWRARRRRIIVAASRSQAAEYWPGRQATRRHAACTHRRRPQLPGNAQRVHHARSPARRPRGQRHRRRSSAPSPASTPTSTASPSPVPKSAPASRRSTSPQQNLEDEDVQLRTALSDEIEVDLVEAISNLTARQVSLEASLKRRRTSCRLSLLNFICSTLASHARHAHANLARRATATRSLRSFSGFAAPRCRADANSAAGLVAMRRVPRIARRRSSLRGRASASGKARVAIWKSRRHDSATLQVSPSDILLFEQGLIGLRALPPLGGAGRRAERRARLAAVDRRARTPRSASSARAASCPTTSSASPARTWRRCNWPARATRRSWSIVSRHPEGLVAEPAGAAGDQRRRSPGRQVIAKDPLPVRLILPTDGEMRLTA